MGTPDAPIAVDELQVKTQASGNANRANNAVTRQPWAGMERWEEAAMVDAPIAVDESQSTTQAELTTHLPDSRRPKCKYMFSR